MVKKTFQLSLPEFRLKTALLLLTVVFGVLGGLHWYKRIYPYYRIKHAVVYAPTREIKAEEIGVLLDSTLNEGDEFQKGASLFALSGSLDSSEIGQIDGKILGLTKQIAEATVKVDQIMEQYQYLQKELGAIDSSEILGEIMADVQVWQDKRTDAELMVAGLESKRSSIQEKIAKLSGVAPFEGVVLKRFAEPGEKMKTGDSVLLLGQKNISIEAVIPETMLTSISLNQQASVQLPSYPGKTWEGQICWISPSARDGKLKIRVFAEDLPFKPGLTAQVSIKIR